MTLIILRILLSAFLFVVFVQATPAPCPLVLSINITNANRLSDGTLVSEGYSFSPRQYFLQNGTIRGCICEVKKCIRKCCPVGSAMYGKKCKDYTKPFSVDVHNNTEPITSGVENDFYYIPGKACKGAIYRLQPSSYPDEIFYVQRDGNLYMPRLENQILHPQDYCVEVFINKKGNESFSALVCEYSDEEIEHETRKRIYSLGMIISMPFLLLTFIVYALLPERNLHGKSLMCYVITLFGAYFLLVFIQLYPHNFPLGSCRALGLFCLFFFMVSFFWMNVMSIDIWWAFSGLRGFSGSRKEAERKRFLLYSGYAWGMPLLHVILVICLTLGITPPNVDWYNPGMGDGQCWFRSGVPTLVYFYGPMAILIIINITLFIITAWKIKQVQQDTAMLRKDESKKHSYENDKQRFNLYLKLMLAMGVNWSMEIISWAVNWQVGHVPPAVWYITDFCNALYGVFIFFIFVFKKNIWKLLKRRYYLLMGKPHLARSMTQTASSPRTTGTSFNNTISTDTKGYANDSSILTSEVA